MRGTWVQAWLPQRYPRERDLRGCRGGKEERRASRSRGEGKPGKRGRERGGSGRARLSAGPKGPCSASSAAGATPLPSPHPSAPHSAPEAGRGKYPPRDFRNPGVRAASAFPEPWHPPPPSPVNTACLPPGCARRPRSAEGRLHASSLPRLRVPCPVPALMEPDRASCLHPALAAQTDNLRTKRRQPRSGPGTGARRHPLPKSKPLSQLTRRGAPLEGVRRSRASRERKRRREGPREIRRLEGGEEEGEEEGKRQQRRRDGDRDQGAGRGRRPLCLRTMRRGKGAQGGARGEGGAGSLPPRVGLSLGLTPTRPNPWSSALCPQGPSTASLPVALKNPGVQIPSPSSPTQGGGP
ncbi:hypothetical protein P7K49_007619 [Saguinus oedipus]|uniref:Uncharacterized protein n=1 Tax=Saguinus oedipus TaxID=9490 RepID=A0ABQ9VVF2_SAGOE|nr:hypothetical protein P7K49_007619 [Saguinus oedipus]